MFVGDPDVVAGVDGETIGVTEAVCLDAGGENGIAGGRELGCDADGAGRVDVVGDPDVAGGVDAEGSGLEQATAGVMDEERPIGWGGGERGSECSTGEGLLVECGDVCAGIAD